MISIIAVQCDNKRSTVKKTVVQYVALNLFWATLLIFNGQAQYAQLSTWTFCPLGGSHCPHNTRPDNWSPVLPPLFYFQCSQGLFQSTSSGRKNKISFISFDHTHISGRKQNNKFPLVCTFFMWLLFTTLQNVQRFIPAHAIFLVYSFPLFYWWGILI